MVVAEFGVKWMEAFSKNISRGVFLWSILSSELVKCLSGDDAKTDYNKVDKTETIEILFEPCVDRFVAGPIH